MLRALLTCSILMTFAPTAYAGVCESKAAARASSMGGRVVDVRDRGKHCVVKIHVAKSGSIPRVVRVKIPK